MHMKAYNQPGMTVKKAVLLTALAKYSNVLIQLIFTMILSRILTPTEFGIVAVVMVFISFFSLLSDFGLGAGVIQNKKLSDRDVNDIFSCSIYLGLVLMMFFILLSYPIATFYNDTIYLKLCPLLSVSVLFGSFNMIPNAIMLKHKKFASIAKRTITSSILSSIFTIVLAMAGWGVYALCLNVVFSSLIIFIWNEASVRLRFYWIPSIMPIKSIWGYSMYQFASQFVNFFSRNLDNLLIGKIFTKADLAYYNKSHSLMMMPIMYIPGVITPVLHPILSEYQNDKMEIFVRFMRLIKPLCVIGFLISSICFIFGNEIILLMFGNQWDKAVRPFQILSIGLSTQLLPNFFGPIYNSLGDNKLLFKSTLLSSIIILSSICIGAWMGNIIYVSFMVTVGYFVSFFVSFYILLRIAFSVPFLSFIREITIDFIIYFIFVLVSSYFLFHLGIVFWGKLLLFLIYVLIYLIGCRRFSIIKTIFVK